MNGGGGVVFATGTPIANSMAEMFTMQRYLQPTIERNTTCITSIRGRRRSASR
jgi:N12 class adenine-specific DNA methylase